MNSLTSLDRPVVWRFDAPSDADLARFRARVGADLAGVAIPLATRPFVVVTPAGLRHGPELLRACTIRGVGVVERRVLSDWPRAATLLQTRDLDPAALVRAFTREQLWQALFPRGVAELWCLDGEGALERARAWRLPLSLELGGVRVTVQGLRESYEEQLGALYVPDSAEVEHDWRALTALH